MARTARENRSPKRSVRWLLSRPEEEVTIRGNQPVHCRQQGATRLQRKIEHYVAKKNNVKALLEWQRCAQIGLSEIAYLSDLRLDDPVLANMIEIGNEHAGGQSTIHLDAVIASLARTPHDFSADVGSFDAKTPAGQLRKVLPDEDGKRVCFLPGRASSAPQAQPPGCATRFNEFWYDLGPQQIKGSAIAEEAGFVNGHRLGNGTLQFRALREPQKAHHFVEPRHTVPVKKADEARLEEMVVRGLQHVL